MNNKHDIQNNNATIPAAIQTKREFAATVRMSQRTVVGWMSRGMPHLRPGPRKILIETGPALEWLRSQCEVRARPSDYRPRRKAAVVAEDGQ
jgi:hypothetical protein